MISKGVNAIKLIKSFKMEKNPNCFADTWNSMKPHSCFMIECIWFSLFPAFSLIFFKSFMMSLVVDMAIKKIPTKKAKREMLHKLMQLIIAYSKITPSIYPTRVFVSNGILKPKLIVFINKLWKEIQWISLIAYHIKSGSSSVGFPLESIAK